MRRCAPCQPGFSAFDEVEGNLTDAVVFTAGPAIRAPLGLHTLVYDVVDSSGNHAEQKSRAVTLVDTRAPILTRRHPKA